MVDVQEQARRRVDDLRRLLRDLTAACDAVPGLDRAAGAVGAPGSWTGTAADRLHGDELAPIARAMPRELGRAIDAVRDELAHAERSARTAREGRRPADVW